MGDRSTMLLTFLEREPEERKHGSSSSSFWGRAICVLVRVCVGMMAGLAHGIYSTETRKLEVKESRSPVSEKRTYVTVFADFETRSMWRWNIEFFSGGCEFTRDV